MIKRTISALLGTLSTLLFASVAPLTTEMPDDKSSPRWKAQVIGAVTQSTNGDEYLFAQPPLVFVGGWGRELNIYDSSDSTKPRLVGKLNSQYATQSAAVRGSIVCALGRLNGKIHADTRLNLTGLNIIDISDTHTPSIVGTAPLDNLTPRAIAVAKEFAYCIVSVGKSLPEGGSQSTSRLLVFDIRKPTNPARRGVLEMEGNPISVSTDGEYLYVLEQVNVYDMDTVATRSEALRIINVHDPDSPKEISHVETDPGNSAFAVSRNFLFLTSRDKLRVFDLRRDSRPTMVDEEQTGLQWRGLVTTTNRAFVFVSLANKQPGLVVFDITHPKRLRRLGEAPLYITPGLLNEAIALSDDVLVQLNDGRLETIGITKE